MKLRLISEGEHKDAFGTHKWKNYAQIPTNADRIRAMTDKELSFFLWWFVDGSGKTKDQWLDWLKQECKT